MAYSAEYGKALEDIRIAGAAFRQIQAAYRAKAIGDAEYLAGRAAYLTSSKAFDDAEAAEAAEAAEDERVAKKCDDCGKNWADPPSRLCPGCQAYQEHQR